MLSQESQRILFRIDRYNRFDLADAYCSKLEKNEKGVTSKPNATDVLKVMSSIEQANKLTRESFKLQRKLEKLKAKADKKALSSGKQRIAELKKKIQEKVASAEMQRQRALEELSKLKVPQKESVQVRSGLIKAVYNFEEGEI